MNDDQIARAALVGVGVVLLRPYYLRAEKWFAELLQKAVDRWRSRRA